MCTCQFRPNEDEGQLIETECVFTVSLWYFQRKINSSFTSLVTDSPIQSVLLMCILFLVTQGNVLLATDFHYQPGHLVKLYSFAAQE